MHAVVSLSCPISPSLHAPFGILLCFFLYCGLFCLFNCAVCRFFSICWWSKRQGGVSGLRNASSNSGGSISSSCSLVLLQPAGAILNKPSAVASFCSTDFDAMVAMV